MFSAGPSGQPGYLDIFSFMYACGVSLGISHSAHLVFQLTLLHSSRYVKYSAMINILFNMVSLHKMSQSDIFRN